MKRSSSDRVCSPIAATSSPGGGTAAISLAVIPRPRPPPTAPPPRPADGGERLLEVHPQCDQAVKHQRTENQEQGVHHPPVEIACGEEVARAGERRDRERQCDQRPGPDRVQPDGPAAGRAREESLHQRAPAPEEVHEERGEDDHRDVQGDACQALPVGERRAVEPVQGHDDHQRNEEHREPAQRAPGECQGRLVPAEVADRHPAPVEEPGER